MEQQFYSIRQAAKEVGLPYATLYSWIFNDVVPSPEVKVGCRIFFTAEEVAQLKKDKAAKYKRPKAKKGKAKDE